jgi:hypothetical protein
LKIGDSFILPTMTSTSLRADFFTNPLCADKDIFLEIEIDSSAYFIDCTLISQYTAEKEILLPFGLTIDVLDVIDAHFNNRNVLYIKGKYKGVNPKMVTCAEDFIKLYKLYLLDNLRF